jgi:hypothetical protein
MLASPALVDRPLQARPRMDLGSAVSTARRALGSRPATVEVGEPGLVFYPFLLERTTRRPLRPLAELPPAFNGSWEASGSDLVYDDAGESDDPLSRSAARIPMIEEPPAWAEVVFYPFFRVPVQIDGEDDAVWIDAVDGQVMTTGPGASAQASAASSLTSWLVPTLAVGAVSGLLLPFPVSLLPAGGAAVWAWRRAGRP